MQPEAYAKTLFGHHPRFVEQALTQAGLVPQGLFGVGIAARLVGLVPALGVLLPPSLALSRLSGFLTLAPTLFVLAEKTRKSA